MSVPEVALDDLRFQELVDQSRRRVARYCPEWTAVNVSDPGITLIELFAWMTDMLSYRINRLPEKLHVALLSLLDVHLQPARAAASELHFQLEQPPRAPVTIAAHETEVATRRTPTQEAVVFQTTKSFVIHPAQPEACLLKRGDRLTDVTVSRGYALPAGEERFAFSRPPKPDDALILGFRRPLDRLLLRVTVDCQPARGVGVDPQHPPLVWEVSARGGRWAPVEVLHDATDGFNKGRGDIDLELPAQTGAHTIGERRLYWLRCCVVAARDEPYSGPPEIFSLTAEPVGAVISAEHCQRLAQETLGSSDGTPGECFRLRHAPILSPNDDEHLEVLAPDSSEWERWERVATFADSEPQDPHYMLDESAGEIELGPAVRQADGRFRYYGAVPLPGSELRFSAYRRGGGTAGNVAARTLTQLRRPIPGVSSVINPQAASGGADGESVALARERTAIELRTRYRAVTREDFEHLSVAASDSVARARCIPGAAGGLTSVHIVPKANDPARRLSLQELTPSAELLRTVARSLDECRLVGTTVVLAPARLRAVKVVVQAVAMPAVDPNDLERRILDALYTYLNPLVGGSASGEGDGWRFQRALRQGELYPVVHGVDGVGEIRLLRVYEEQLASGESSPNALDGDLELAADELIASGTHRVRVEPAHPVKVQASPSS